MSNQLFEEFPPVSSQEWDECIKNELKGEDVRKLIWQTREGFEVFPYYRREQVEHLPFLFSRPGVFPYVRGTEKNRNEWQIVEDIVCEDDLPSMQMKIQRAIQRGAEAVRFKLEEADISQLISLLGTVNPHHHDVYLSFSKPAGDDVISLVHEIQKHFPRHKNIFLDPGVLSHLASCGNFRDTEEKDMTRLSLLLRDTLAMDSCWRVAGIDGTFFKEAGGTLVHELAGTLSMAVEYLHRLSEKGISPLHVVPQIYFTLAVGSNFFFEIAKFRAFRVLWAGVAKAYGCSPSQARAYVHAITCRYNKTLYDPYVNMLRATTEAMAAVLGGVNALTVEPYDVCFRHPDDFSSRIARNVQLILKEEAGFNRVADPAGGSYYVEKITENLIEKAWEKFLFYEKEGGFLEILRKGILQEEISHIAMQQRQNIARRRKILVGTNQYPDLSEATFSRIAWDVYEKKNPPQSRIVEPVLQQRMATDFEQLRLATEKSSYRPKVFLLPVGQLAPRLARSQFACNFFGCAGFEIIDNTGFASLDEGVAQALAAGAHIVVLCSSDEEYATYAPALHQKLSGKAMLVVAGNPPCKEDLKKAGIENFISIHSNVLETLREYQQKLGII